MGRIRGAVWGQSEGCLKKKIALVNNGLAEMDRKWNWTLHFLALLSFNSQFQELCCCWSCSQINPAKIPRMEGKPTTSVQFG